MSVIFPKWINVLPTALAIGSVLGLTAVVGGFYYYATPKFYKVGYMPKQPGGGFNHQIHAGKLGMDYRYCHTKIEKSYEANIPNVATCYGCHKEGNLELYNTSDVHKAKTEFIREAYLKDDSIPWRRVHKVPEYVHNFPHQAHLNAGVSCYSCHGMIPSMPEVYQVQPLSMGWCLDCHRDPGPAVLEPENKDKITRLPWVKEHLDDRAKAGTAKSAEEMAGMNIKPPENCGACHY